MTQTLVRESFERQADACVQLGSPLTARVCRILADALQDSQGTFAQRVLNWPGDPAADALALRVCAGLHALVRADPSGPLAEAYATASVTPELLLRTIEDHEACLLSWLDHPPQTNEVGRSSVIIAAARFIAGLVPWPIDALELGASAGLNLNFHKYHLRPRRQAKGALPPPLAVADAPASDSPGIFLAKAGDEVVLTPHWQGDLPTASFTVSRTAGVDLAPLDPCVDAQRLLAYCWADQPDRMGRLQAALRLSCASPAEVTAGDAAAWLDGQLARRQAGTTSLVYHTIAWQYFAPATQRACAASLMAAGRAATLRMPLAHLSMEADGGEGAALTLRLWTDHLRVWDLGRADFHGRWVQWRPVPRTDVRPVVD